MMISRRWRIEARLACTLMLTVVELTAGQSCRRSETASPSTIAPAGSLPSGCVVAAELDRKTLGELSGLADSLLAAPSGTLIPEGLDFRHAVERIHLCRFGGDPGSTGATVLLMSGTIPGDVLDRIAAQRRDLSREIVGGVPILGGGRFWMAHRGPATGAGELVVASGREVLRRAIAERPATYALDPEASFSLVLAPSEIRRLLLGRREGEASPLSGVQELQAKLSAGGTVLNVRLLVGNEDAARRLVFDLQTAVGNLLRKIHPEVENIPVIDLQVQAGDVVARIEFPPHGMTTMAAKLAAAWSKRPRGPR